MPALAEGFSDRPDTARGILDALIPGSTIALVPGSEFAEGKQNWLGASGKTQIAVMLAETLWRSGAVDVVVWISATSRSAVLSGYVEAWMAATGIEPTGTAESVAARFVSWLAETDQPWLVVLDDLPSVDELDGLWPEGPAGRLLITSAQSTVAASRYRTRIFPVGFFSVREALGCLTERLSVNPVQRQGAIDLIEALGREPLALAQAAAVIVNSTLACRDYRDYFVRRRQQIGVAAGEVPSAASVTWTLSLGQAEQLLPGQSVRLMLVLIALLDGHGIPGAVFNTQSVSVYLGGPAVGFGTPVDPQPAWDALLICERAGLISYQPGRGTGDDPDEPGVAGRDQAGRPRRVPRAGGADGGQRAAGSVAGRRARAMDGRRAARERDQPAGRGHRRPVGRRVPSAAAARRAEPGRRPPGRAGRRVLAGAVHPLRQQAGPGAPRRAGRRRSAGRRLPGGRRTAPRRSPGTGGSWPNAASISRPGIRPSSRRGSAWPTR